MTKRIFMQKRVFQATLLSVLLCTAGQAQFPISRPGVPPDAPLGSGHGQEDDSPFGENRHEMLARQAKLLHQQHQKEVVADSALLVQLAAQLKAQTDQGVTATPNELKDVDQIAKLAHKLSDRIKNE